MIMSSHSWLVHGLTCELGTINNFSIGRGKNNFIRVFMHLNCLMHGHNALKQIYQPIPSFSSKTKKLAITVYKNLSSKFL
jgi:hypothetical protein